jgi:hypothetical protein
MSKNPDTVSQFKNCLRIGQPFFQKDWLAVYTTPIVSTATLTKRTRREALLIIDEEAEELTKRSEQRRTDSWKNDIISENGNGAINSLKFSHRTSGSEENKRLQLKGVPVPHRGELVPLKRGAIWTLPELGPAAV